MPKKKHLHRYSKPQSTSPALRSSSAARRNDSNHDDASPGRTVNELLAQLRRTGLSGSSQPPLDAAVRPTVPPELRQILGVPETPPPRPRRPLRPGPGGPRLPAGPAPPRSWLSAAERADHALQTSAVLSRPAVVDRNSYRPLPGLNLPSRRTLLDMVLRRFVADWEWQRAYCHYHLYELPTHLRVALVAYLAAHHPDGVSIRDLRAILLPPPDVPDYLEDPDLAPAVVNGTFTHLDLSGSLGRSIRLRELTDFLFPPQPKAEEAELVQDSWDAADPIPPDPLKPPAVLPNLTHLSLALDPAAVAAAAAGSVPSVFPGISWRHLLSLASHLPALTHLSLAYWPEPSLTPRATFRAASVASPVTGRAVAYGGTGPYSRSLDADWAEPVLVLRKLSRSLYGLEWLDLTGCGAWFPALWEGAPLVADEEEDGEERGESNTPAATAAATTTATSVAVDWVGGWGKVNTLVMFPGYRLPEDAREAERARYWEIVDQARRVERHVRACRAGGKGRFLTVETCQREEGVL
ncbi:hypothetical protein VTJ04DRAFT_5507 [Mycothermus thermophilus]|uniref:uncharacterized protein n=1 Tax=Humicola insolens TaxID=85995 RepID=UPI0037431201